MAGPHHRYDHRALHEFTAQVLVAHGLTAEAAATAADALVHADLMGIDSHGIAHLAWHTGYVPGLRSGLVNPRPNITATRESPTTAVLDADGAMGVIAGAFAQRLAIQKAAAAGVGIVAVGNSRHFGAAGHWALMSVPEGQASLVTCNSSPIVAPAGGRDRVWGTNPIAFAAPAGSNPPFMYDAATSVVAAGKLELAGYEGEDIPHGWARDADFADTTDAHVLGKGGVLLPLGGDPVGSWHKGHGLAAMVDVLSGILGANGHSLALRRGGDRYGHVGHFHISLRIDAFRDPADWAADIDRLYADVHATRPVGGTPRVLMPGEKEHAIEQDRRLTGIPLPARVVDQLTTLAIETAVPFPLPLEPLRAV